MDCRNPSSIFGPIPLTSGGGDDSALVQYCAEFSVLGLDMSSVSGRLRVHECDCAQERGRLKEVEELSYFVDDTSPEGEKPKICQV